MAELAILLRLRFRLWRRQWRVGKGMLAVLILGVLFLVAITIAITFTLTSIHAELSTKESLRFGQLCALALAALLIAGPLIGFRGQEFLDVTKLFTLPVKPWTVFLSTVFGSFLSGISLFTIPLLVVPPIDRNPERALEIVAVTLAFLTVLYATVQCVTLAFLNVLRSRRFRDLAALFAPAIGLSIYAGMQGLLYLSAGPGVHPALRTFLRAERLDVLDDLQPFLPPLWHAESVFGDRSAWVVVLLLLALVVALSWLGAYLTVQAFHGQVARTTDERTKHEEASGFLDRVLPTPLAALHHKERILQRRDPWMRMLLIQQLGFIALITVGEGFVSRQDSGTRGFPIWLLLYFEAGFLQNQLGLEGSAFRQTALLPVRGTSILIAKNLVWLRTFVLGNLLMVPGLSFLGAWLGERAIDGQDLAMQVTMSIVVLPAIFGTANLVSVYLPLRVPQRSRRALGQDQSQGGGCTTTFFRIVFALLALVPAVVCALLLLRPWQRDPSIDRTWILVILPSVTALSSAIYWFATRAAGAALDDRRPRLAAYLK